MTLMQRTGHWIMWRDFYMDEYDEARYLGKANEWWDQMSNKEKKETWEEYHTFSVFKRTPTNIHVINGWWRTLSNTEKILIYLPELKDEMIDVEESNIYL